MVLLLEQSQQTLADLGKKINALSESLDIDGLTKSVAELEAKSQDPEFWNDPKNSQTVLVQLKDDKERLESYIDLKKRHESATELLEMALLDDDDSLAEEILAEVDAIAVEYESQKIQILLSGEYDKNNAIISIHPGAGGTEAQDWAQMLFRMYCRYAEMHGFKAKTLDYLEGDEAGIKSVTFSIEGRFAYGYLKGENGVHRLVRVSPFDSSGRRHTSFASVEVMPELSDDINIEIREEDLEIEAHRASGAGGQHVNKTDSAIRIRHIPTGIIVGCQNERSQLQNKEVALKMLKAKLLQIKEKEQLDKIDSIKGVKLNIEWGAQIRSYVFMPYTLVKDHRTEFETGDIQKVMDGSLDGFINAYLVSQV